jgi:hypothetical protein
MTDILGPGPRATQACVSCRRQKRRCDKIVPECSLCRYVCSTEWLLLLWLEVLEVAYLFFFFFLRSARRIGRSCDYETASSQSVDRDDFDSLQQKVLDLEARLSIAQSTPTSGSFEHPPANGSSGSLDTNASPPPPATSSQGLSSSLPKSHASGNGWQPSSPFPSIFFLDSRQFEDGSTTVQKPHVVGMTIEDCFL